MRLKLVTKATEAVRPVLSALAWQHFPRAASGLRARKGRKLDARLGLLTPREAFTYIYREALWGRSQDGLGSSGAGSHDPSVVDPYVRAVAGFLETLPKPKTLVDLGCGDMAVGLQLIPLVDRYVGCDVVPGLIAEHERRHAGSKVQFACIDIVEDDLPRGDVATVRQVLQHLSNAQIGAALPKLARYKHVIVTEHVPRGSFRPNVDKPMGPGTRLAEASGVVLGACPFELPEFVSRLLCRIEADRGVIETRLYTRSTRNEEGNKGAAALGM